MSLRLIQILEGVFAIAALIGLAWDEVPRWTGWLSCFLCVALDTWRCLRVGKISTGPDYRWYGFTFDRDDSPEFFAGILFLQVLVAMLLLFIFLCSL